MNLNYNVMSSQAPLSCFSSLPGFLAKLNYLATRLAELEDWEYESGYTSESDTPELMRLRRKVGVLYQYIHHTFSKAQLESKIVFTDDRSFAIMNTGLLTTSAEEIFMLFSKNTNTDDSREYELAGFYRQSAHEIPVGLRAKLPSHIDYFENCPSDMYFNVNWEINANVEHIIRDNFHRLPETLKSIGDDQIIATTLNALMLTMKKRILRNNRLIVPQYYNHKIMYLAPLKYGNDIITLAIEKHEGTYRANTILTMGMAYCNARLIAKPESNWLVNK